MKQKAALKGRVCVTYHVTFWDHAASILTDGIRPPVGPGIWRGKFGALLSTPGRVYAWTNREHAILWAGKMRWDFGPGDEKPEPAVAVVTLQKLAWYADENPTLRDSAVGRAGFVGPEEILAVERVTTEMLRAAIKAENDNLRRFTEAIGDAESVLTEA